MHKKRKFNLIKLLTYNLNIKNSLNNKNIWIKSILKNYLNE